MEQPCVPPPPARNRYSVKYVPGMTGPLWLGLIFLESFQVDCLPWLCRKQTASLGTHPLSVLRTEMNAPAGSGFAGEQVIDSWEEDPPAHATASRTPSAFRVRPWVAGGNNVAPGHTGNNTRCAAAAPGKTPDQVVHQNPSLRAAKAATNDAAVPETGILLEDNPLSENAARADLGFHAHVTPDTIAKRAFTSPSTGHCQSKITASVDKTALTMYFSNRWHTPMGVMPMKE